MDGAEPVIFENRGGIASLTLNRPAVLNAMSIELRDHLWSLLDVIELDDEIGVVVFRGAGNAFSSGADLTEFGTSPSFVQSWQARRDRDLWQRLATFRKPMIAAVHGYALGAGCELSLYCDFRIAADDARFGLPEVGLGYLPSAGGTQTTPRLIGLGRALHLVCSGTPISAAEALQWGLVREVVPREDLDAAAERLARRLLAQPARALQTAKAVVFQGLDLTLDQGLVVEAAARSRLVMT